jgi:hypothetical protein
LLIFYSSRAAIRPHVWVAGVAASDDQFAPRLSFESVKPVVQILDDVLRLCFRELLVCHVAATFELPLQAIERPDLVVLAAIDSSIVTPGTVGIVQAFSILAIAWQRCCVRAHRKEH